MNTLSKKLAHLVRYRVNKVGHPFGLNLFPMAWELDVQGERSTVFDDIFDRNFWGGEESRSGPGSERHYVSRYRVRLADLIRRRRWRSIFDAPCGDLFWMSQLLEDQAVTYHGGDVSPSVVRLVKAKYPMLDIRVFDICEDEFPNADVWHCRDCFFHLPFCDIRSALARFTESTIPWALLTTHRATIHRNLDVRAGGYRILDLERPPFSFPPPVEYIRDFRLGRSFPRYVGLWSRETVARTISAF